MSKNNKVNAGQKRQIKAAKRKNKSRTAELLPPNSLEVLLRKAKYQAGLGTAQPQALDKRDVEQVNQAKKHLRDLYNYFNYLVFVKELVDSGVIKGVGWQIDLLAKGKEILSLNHRLKVVPLIDDDTSYSVELYSIAGDIQSLGYEIVSAVNKTAEFQKTIYLIMLKCGEALPPKEDGQERTPDEVMSDVIKMSGQDFFYKNYRTEETKTAETA